MESAHLDPWTLVTMTLNISLNAQQQHAKFYRKAMAGSFTGESP